MTDSAGLTNYEEPHARNWLASLLEGRIDVAWRAPPAHWSDSLEPPPAALLSGSFNPRHSGHLALRRAAEDFLCVPAGYEMSLVNADKPAIDMTAALLRCRQFDDAPLAITRVPTFVEKSRLFPGCVFVIGIDTALRILDERFYPDAGGCSAALAAIAECGCRFLVAGRLCAGRFLQLSDLPLPPPARSLFDELPADRFRSDLSSTALRNTSRIH